MQRRSDPSTQTTEEWQADYDRASQTADARPKSVPASREPVPLETQFRYVDHRTTSFGSVVLQFESLDRSISAVKFFNIALRSPRGNSYPSGNRGQFRPPERGKFRNFWMQAVGTEPWRWCRVHKSMRSTLGALVFKGQYRQARDSKGQIYFKITNIRAI